MESMRQMFRDSGYRVLCARGEAEAVAVIEAVRPDVVVTEVMLDRQNGGFGLAWKIKNKYPDVPVIMVSAVTWHTGLYFSLTTPGARNWIKADAFMDKPIRHEELVSVIQNTMVSGPAQ